MTHYEYKTKNGNEIEILKKHTDIDFEDVYGIIFSLTKKQIRRIKLGTLENAKEYSIIKRIMFESEIVGHGHIMEKTTYCNLVDGLTEAIDKEILENVIKMGNKSE